MEIQRKIIHIDMDCFYAAIEMRDDPSLAGKPVAVGGHKNSRGVLCTCNYEARRFGIHSAMPSAHAIRLCPDLIILPVNFEKYRTASRAIQNIFKQYTDAVEPLSLDEAYLDVSNSSLQSGSATLIAKDIRNRIFLSEKLIASAGISFNKMLAKIASDWNKPNGQFVITPDMLDKFMYQLPVKKLFGVGKVTTEKLREKNIITCGDVLRQGRSNMIRLFGNFGNELYQMSQGKDDRPVITSWTRKSLSVENTFEKDVFVNNMPAELFDNLYQELCRRLEKAQKNDHRPVKTISVKIKYSDFTQTTIQSSSVRMTKETFYQLFLERVKNSNIGIRLIGLGVSFSDKDEKHSPEQLELYLDQQNLTSAIENT